MEDVCGFSQGQCCHQEGCIPSAQIQDILDTLSGQAFLSTLDLFSGYHQIAMAEDSVEKTSFTSHYGTFAYLKMPFGLTNAPSHFQRTMDIVLSGLTFKSCMVYIDDILCFSPTFDDHIKDLTDIFERLRKYNLKLKMKKCAFARQQVEFLGHIVSPDGLAVDPSKVSAVKNWPIPKTLKDVQSFLGFCNYYRRFIKDFAKIAKDLYSVKDEKPLQWTFACQSAFDTLKDKLCSTEVLAFPNFKQEFLLYTDASDVALGAVLSQREMNGERIRPVAYASRVLSKTEKNYSVIEREALGIVWAVQTYRHYLYGHKVLLITDHRPLQWLMTVKDSSGKLCRWALTLQEYDISIQYRPGSQNANADALSRISTGAEQQDSALPSTSKSADSFPVPSIHYLQVFTAQPTSDGLPAWVNLNVKIQEEQRKDPKLLEMISFFESGTLPKHARESSQLKVHSKNFGLVNGTLYYTLHVPNTRRAARLGFVGKTVVPEHLRPAVLQMAHSDCYTGGHLGIKKTKGKVFAKFYWDRWSQDCELYCQSCLTCLKRKKGSHNPKAPLNPITVSAPFEIVAMDALGPLCESWEGDKHIVVFSDYLTRYVEAFPVVNLKAPTIAHLLFKEIICRYGAPQKLLSDRGTPFLNQIVQGVCEIMNTLKINTTAYHPETDGLVERFNHTVCQMLSMYVQDNPRTWAKFLPAILFSYRTSIQESLNETPFFMLFGRDAPLPIDTIWRTPNRKYVDITDYVTDLKFHLQSAWEIARANLQQSHQKQAIQYNKKAKPTKIQVNDWVLKKNPVAPSGVPKKLDPHHFIGPYRVIALNGPVATLSAGNRRDFRVHTNNLRKVLDSYENFPPGTLPKNETE